MALDIPVNTPLTDNQADITAKIGSMLNLLSLPSTNYRNIPKNQQISTYDFLLLILDKMGVSIEDTLNNFINKIFDQTGNFLETAVTNSIADSLGQAGIMLAPYTNTPNPTPAQQQAYKTSNRSYVGNIVATTLGPTFMNTIKQQLAKDLMIMLFGGSTTSPSVMILNPNPGVVNTLTQNAVCAEGLFAISNPGSVTDQQLSYNRVALKQQLAAGTVTYVISCQSVKISLPQNPAFIFNGGGQFSSSASGPPTPAQSLQFLTQYVNNQVQNINNETNAQKGGSTFQQNMVEKIVNYMAILVQTSIVNPTYLVPAVDLVFGVLNAVLTPAQQLKQSAYVYSNCDIAADPTNTTKAQFTQTMFDSLYQELIRQLLLLAISKFKGLVSNYFGKLATEKAARAFADAQLSLELLAHLPTGATGVQKYAAALATLEGVIGGKI